jgi:hypothetical protein
MFLVDPLTHEFRNQDVVAGLTSDARTMTKHEAERSFEHRFVGLLQAGFIVEGENLFGRP